MLLATEHFRSARAGLATSLLRTRDLAPSSADFAFRLAIAGVRYHLDAESDDSSARRRPMSKRRERQLTDTERLTLINQFTILEALIAIRPELVNELGSARLDRKFCEWAISVLYSGYTILIDDLFEGIEASKLTHEDQVEILDILDMWRDLQYSYDKLESKGDLPEAEIAFPGWDGNSDRGELGFARLYCRRGEDVPVPYARIRPAPDLDAHLPMIDRYRQMLKIYLPLRESKKTNLQGPEFSLDEIRRILLKDKTDAESGSGGGR